MPESRGHLVKVISRAGMPRGTGAMEEIREGEIILESFLSLSNLSSVPPFG